VRRQVAEDVYYESSGQRVRRRPMVRWNEDFDAGSGIKLHNP